jgi:DNA-binding transcriptional MerR regulator
MERRTIGQLAQAVGVAVDTVRYYERIGLLDRPPRQRTGWRRYPPEALIRLQYIRHGRAVGFTLQQLAGLLALANQGPPRFCAAFDAAVNEKIRAIDVAIAQLNATRAQLAGFSQACRQRRLEGRCPILENLGPQNTSQHKRSHSHGATTITGSITFEGLREIVWVTFAQFLIKARATCTSGS